MSKHRNINFQFLKGRNFTAGIYMYVILAIVPILLYIHSVDFGYSGFDDEEIIVKKSEFITQVENIPLAFKRDAFMNTNGDSFYRPIGNISFMLDSQIGGVNAWIYHADNNFLHVLSLLLALYLCTLLGIDRRAALLVLLILSVHPIFTHAVCWIPSRMDLLLSVFSISSFVMFLKFIQTKKKRFIVFHFLFFFLAVFSKETAAILPLVLSFYYYLVFPTKQKKTMPVFWTGWSLIIVVYLVMRAQVLHNQTSAGYFNILASFENLQVIPTILAKLLLPINLSPMPRFETVSTVLGILLLGIMVFITLRKEERGNYNALAFGILWYLLFMLPPVLYTNQVAVFGFYYLEHRA